MNATGPREHAKPLSHGEPGSIYAVLVPTAAIQSRTAWAMNSGPLSERMKAGTPRKMNRSVSASITSVEFSLRCTRTVLVSLTPRSGEILLDRVEEIRGALVGGQDYASRSAEARFAFVCSIIALLSEVPAFRIGRTLGRKRTFREWEKLLRWWLFKSSLARQPPAKDLGNWFKFVSENFIYRGSWGLGSIIGVLLDRDSAGQPLDAITIDDWPRS